MAFVPELHIVPLLLVLLFHGWGTTANCGPCDLLICGAPEACRVPEMVTTDECGCCPQCLGVEGESCGGMGWGHRRCASGLVCVSRRHSENDNTVAPGDPSIQLGTGECICKEEGAVCGSDGHSYPSICALHLRSWLALHEAGRGGHEQRVHKLHDGECKFAPIIISASKMAQNVTGGRIYLSCEVKAVPTPVLSWRKIIESPKGIQLLEELPGDRTNIAVQVRGGPSKHESTGWLLINLLTKEDEGVYQCHATNILGEASAEGIVKVTRKL
ncbi:insulin-like growth factor-binding protein-like 1 [Protopterus annectens]|uniref:insulin-like growth factor-binding protein-like 1 n=1 Tax=Protopterus annectens TaxID=7888 RepID=UPI001CFAA60D|nr:insulin-like growth factor-binding protein-like 1 [Protopterus annectens]